MSLGEQSQHWFPTSVQVTVHQARSLRAKGKNGTNDSYAIIQVAKDKFSTSVAEKSVAPVWKEEAAFDLPLFHPGNAERCTLNIFVMHRAQVGLDKFLGQAVVNLLELFDNKARKKTDWFKLVDKSGKEDKARGEVLLDIQFMRNNMSASMFDLSMKEKPRSRISKLKDKVRGKKKDSFSDSASAIVPSVSQVLTDSEGEADAQSLNQSPGVKKKSKFKTLFAPKSNLQRNVSQSMSTLGSLPEKNSSLSGSRSSGLNVDSPEVKKKFKFLGHKRSGSSDSKVSQGPFSLLGRPKQSNSDLNSLCINGNHVYSEESEPKSGSTLSLNSSGQGSVEDVHKHTSDVSASSFRSDPTPTYQHESTDTLEQQRHQEEEERRKAEERRVAEAKRLEEETKYRAEAKRLQEEEERRYQEEKEGKRRFLEDEARRRKQREEEDEERRKQEEERRMQQAAEDQRLEEERRRAEEQKKEEEASMSDRLSTLFGMIRKKEEKKEEVPQHPKEESPKTPRHDSSTHDQITSQHSSNPFEDISLDPAVGNNESSTDQKSNHSQQTPSAMVFLNRTAKVSAVKPRLAQILESDPLDFQTPSQLCASPATSESTLSSVPSDSPDSFSNFHSSLAPPNITQGPSRSSRGSTEELSSEESEGSSPTMDDKKRRAPLPPSYLPHGSQAGGDHMGVRELTNPAYEEADRMQQGKKASLPLPDYETLFPQKRHGVQGQTRWDHIIAEVNQRQRDSDPVLLGPEMSVDGPVERRPSSKSVVSQENPSVRHYQIQQEEIKVLSVKKSAAPAPPKQITSPQSLLQKQHQPAVRPAAVGGPGNTDFSSRDSLSGTARDGARKALQPPPASTPASRPSSRMDSNMVDDQRKDAPTAKPRQRVSSKEPTQREDTQTAFSQSMKATDKKSGQSNGNMVAFDPFPSSELLPKDPWAQPKRSHEVDGFFTRNTQKEQNLENQGMTAGDLDIIFSQDKLTDPFASFNRSEPKNNSQKKTKDESDQAGFHAFQRKNSQRRSFQSKTPPPDNKGLKSQQDAPNKDGSTKTAADRGAISNTVREEPVSLQPQVKTQSGSYRGEDGFGAEPYGLPSAQTPSEPLQAIKEEATGSLSGGKTPLQAWVSPSEVQLVNAQNSNGNSLALSARRPHPVKPLTSVESQHGTSTNTAKEIKAWNNTPAKIKVSDSGGSGPYTQLTQEELITLVVKQQTDLSKKDAKIVELEEYIDNLVLRVIEEQPSILQALNSKPV